MKESGSARERSCPAIQPIPSLSPQSTNRRIGLLLFPILLKADYVAMPGPPQSSVGKSSGVLSNLAASSLTGIIVSSLSHPIDTLKCRWQVAGKASQARHVFGFARSVLMEERILTGLWRPGFLPNVMSMACCIGMRNGLYGCFRDRIGQMGISAGKADKVGPAGMFFAGLCSGATGYVIASPLLQVKTQMQAEAGKIGPDGLYATGVLRGHAPTYQSTFKALTALVASSSGPGSAMRTLWRGAGVIVARGSALSASQLMAYDEAKTKLKASGLGDGKKLSLSLNSLSPDLIGLVLLGFAFATLPESTGVYWSLLESIMPVGAI
eukprot:s112_g42.t2